MIETIQLMFGTLVLLLAYLGFHRTRRSGTRASDRQATHQTQPKPTTPSSQPPKPSASLELKPPAAPCLRAFPIAVDYAVRRSLRIVQVQPREKNFDAVSATEEEFLSDVLAWLASTPTVALSDDGPQILDANSPPKMPVVLSVPELFMPVPLFTSWLTSPKPPGLFATIGLCPGSLRPSAPTAFFDAAAINALVTNLLGNANVELVHHEHLREWIVQSGGSAFNLMAVLGVGYSGKVQVAIQLKFARSPYEEGRHPEDHVTEGDWVHPILSSPKSGGDSVLILPLICSDFVRKNRAIGEKAIESIARSLPPGWPGSSSIDLLSVVNVAPRASASRPPTRTWQPDFLEALQFLVNGQHGAKLDQTVCVLTNVNQSVLNNQTWKAGFSGVAYPASKQRMDRWNPGCQATIDCLLTEVQRPEQDELVWTRFRDLPPAGQKHARNPGQTRMVFTLLNSEHASIDRYEGLVHTAEIALLAKYGTSEAPKCITDTRVIAFRRRPGSGFEKFGETT